jgi:protein gp37
LNKQGAPANPSGGIEWTHIFGPGTGFTANPIRGCTHGCKWKMPDGNIATCYAEASADRLNGAGSFKRITFHPEVLDQITARKKGAGIFIDSMSDLLGEAVRAEWIGQVILTMRLAPQHIFFVLTKNPRRLGEFEWPRNCLLGISAPPTFLNGKEMSEGTRQTWFRRAAEWLIEARSPNKWISLEPLTTDTTSTLSMLRAFTGIRFAVIGAASDGSRYTQPDPALLRRTLLALQGKRIFFKGNLSRELAIKCAGSFRQEFPPLADLVGGELALD